MYCSDSKRDCPLEQEEGLCPQPHDRNEGSSQCVLEAVLTLVLEPEVITVSMNESDAFSVFHNTWL